MFRAGCAIKGLAAHGLAGVVIPCLRADHRV
jgi:hypothetical protein